MTCDAFKKFEVVSKEYSPDFCPVNGKLLVKYNNQPITIFISGAIIRVTIYSPEPDGDITFILEQMEVGNLPWKDIVYHVMHKSIEYLMQVAVNQIEFMKAEKTYHVN